MDEGRLSRGTRLSKTRIFGSPEGIPVFVLVWTEQPCEEPSLFFLGPMFRALTVVCIVCVRIVIAPALGEVGVRYWPWIDMLSLNDG